MELTYLGAGITAGLIVFGNAIGIGIVGARAMDAIGRQPEAADKVHRSMLFAVVCMEGVAFGAIAVCFILAVK